MNMIITPEFNHQCACVLAGHLSLSDFLHYFAYISLLNMYVVRDKLSGGHSIFPCFQNIFSYIFCFNMNQNGYPKPKI